MRGIAVLLVTIAAVAATDCPPNWPPEQLIPHEECHKYYQCVWGKRVEMTCPANLYFNDATWQCDWPDNVQCTDSNPTTAPTTAPPCNTTSTTTTSTTTTPTTTTSTTTTPTTTTPTTTTPTTTTPTTTTVAPTTDPGNDCPPNWPPEQLLPHEDCNKYYQCVWGTRVERICPDDLYFNNATWQCDWPYNVQCGDRNSTTAPTTATPTTATPTTATPTTATPTTATPTTATPTTATPTTATPSPTNTPTPTATVAPCSTDPTTAPPTSNTGGTTPTTAITPPPSGFLPNGCPVNPHVHWLLPVPGNCSAFYYCVWGGLVERGCPPTLHFNKAIQVCDWPWSAGCV